MRSSGRSGSTIGWGWDRSISRFWDLAGKYYDAPIHELLGTHRTSIPASTSTYHSDENGRVVPDGPGLGVDYDWDYIEDNQTGSLHVYE